MTKTTIIRFLNSLKKLADYAIDYCSQPTLPKYLHEVLIGLLLSDGSLQKSSPNSAARLSVIFGLKNAAYLMHLFVLFEPYIGTGPDVVSVYNNKTKSSHMVIKFKTLSVPLFVYYYNMFYKLNNNGKYVKYIPKNIEEFISPLVLSHLIMGDGNFKPLDEIIRIYTNSFTKEEVELLALAITNKLSIKAKAVHDRNGQYMITISRDKLIQVRQLLKPYMYPSMYYKLGLKMSSSNSFNYRKIYDEI